VVVKGGRHGMKPGETVWVRPNPGSLHFFDAGENAI
jgi:hypothetical protein